MHKRHGDYPRDRRPTRRRSATLRYALAWAVATAVAVLGVAALLHGPGEDAGPIAVAVERGSCRLEPARAAPATQLRAAIDAGRIVVRYRATLSPPESAQLRRIVQRLSSRAVTVQGVPHLPEIVEATADARRLGCTRLDRRTEQALVLFALSAEEE